MNEFKFVVESPMHEIDRNAMFQRFTISATYPTLAYQIPFHPRNGPPTQEQIRLAVAELKVRLITDISKAEFEQEKR